LVTDNFSVSHTDLVAMAAVWLRKQRHTVVTTEIVSAWEIPDALGWRNSFSTLVECKVSRSDFFADIKKIHRKDGVQALGVYRYYLCPEGLLSVDEIPAKWGLLVATDKGIRKLKDAMAFDDVNRRGEISILLSLLRRIGKDAPEGVSISCYIYTTKNTATLGVEVDE
jgi:hypothetical protein